MGDLKLWLFEVTNRIAGEKGIFSPGISGIAIGKQYAVRQDRSASAPWRVVTPSPPTASSE
jgi:hypothetical protein